jgi:lipoyl(octanoyl) transferase
LSYNVRYEDIGLRDFKETWDYQVSVFSRLVDAKKNLTARSGMGTDQTPGSLILVEHPNVFTLGKSGSMENLLTSINRLKTEGASFYHIDRGGDITYHGPGQVVGYPIFDLDSVNISLKEYIFRIEEVIIRVIKKFGITGVRMTGCTGVWLDPEAKEGARKICAIGVKASRFVTMHGFALNVNTDLSYYSFINPCGFRDKGVTSLEKELGWKPDMSEVKEALRDNFGELFNLAWTNPTVS